MGGTSVTTFGGYQDNNIAGFFLGRHGNPKIIKSCDGAKIIDAKVPFALADGHADVFRGQIDCDTIYDNSPGGLELDRAIVTDSPRGSWPKLSDKKNRKKNY